MTLLYKHDDLGGFIVGDTSNGITCFAYPTSTNSTRARKNPDKVANEMMQREVAARKHLHERVEDTLGNRDADFLIYLGS